MAAGAAAANPFAGVPTFDFNLDFRPMKMATEFSRLMRELQSAVAAQSKRENNGQVQAVTHPDGHYQVLLTPNGGFFAVLMWPPPDAVDEAVPVKLLFSLRDLYLLGFEHGNVYHLFSDAELGPGIDVDNNPWVRRMRFKGKYKKELFKQVHIAVQDLLQTCYTLLNFNDHTPDDETYKALYRIMVIISEALRFVDWLKELICIYMKNKSSPAVDMAGGVKFSEYFHNWSNRSKAVRDGRDAFHGPKYGCDTYDQLLSSSGVCLSR